MEGRTEGGDDEKEVEQRRRRRNLREERQGKISSERVEGKRRESGEA